MRRNFFHIFTRKLWISLNNSVETPFVGFFLLFYFIFIYRSKDSNKKLPRLRMKYSLIRKRNNSLDLPEHRPLTALNCKLCLIHRLLYERDVFQTERKFNYWKLWKKNVCERMKQKICLLLCSLLAELAMSEWNSAQSKPLAFFIALIYINLIPSLLHSNANIALFHLEPQILPFNIRQIVSQPSPQSSLSCFCFHFSFVLFFSFN